MVRVQPVVTGVAAMNGAPVMVVVVPEGMVSVPLPPRVPPVHVDAAPVRLTLPVPLNVPPCILREGMDCALALLMLSAPPDVRTGVAMLPVKVVAALDDCSVPAPVMVEAASKVRVSLVL